MIVTTIKRLRLVKIHPLYSGKCWRGAGEFKALVWDPTAIRALIDEANRKPRREGE